MAVLAECRESDKLKIIYQPWRAGGINFVFDTDGTEVNGGAETGETEYFIKNAVDYRVEPNLDKDVWAFWGKGISQSHYNADGDFDDFCGKAFYWYVRALKGQDIQGVTLEVNDGNWWQFRYPNGQFYQGAWGLVDSDTYANRHELPLQATPLSEFVGLQLRVYDGYYQSSTDSFFDDCYQIYGRNQTTFVTEKDSVELLDATLLERYYKFIAILADGREQLITERTYEDVEDIPVDAYLAEPIEVEVSKPSNSYDFFIDDLGGYFWVRYNHINFNLGGNLLYIASDPGQPPPEYTYSCDVEQCKDNEYQLDCGEHWCCYRSDGVATNRFEK